MHVSCICLFIASSYFGLGKDQIQNLFKELYKGIFVVTISLKSFQDGQGILGYTRN